MSLIHDNSWWFSEESSIRPVRTKPSVWCVNSCRTQPTLVGPDQNQPVFCFFVHPPKLRFSFWIPLETTKNRVPSKKDTPTNPKFMDSPIGRLPRLRTPPSLQLLVGPLRAALLPQAAQQPRSPRGRSSNSLWPAPATSLGPDGLPMKISPNPGRCIFRAFRARRLLPGALNNSGAAGAQDQGEQKT